MEENFVLELDGGVGDVIFAYEDKIVIHHKGVLNFFAMGMKGDKTLYYSDITSVQHKKPGSFSGGYIQFSLPGGKENTGGFFGAASDENTITYKNDANIIQKAEEIIAYINEKIRELKTDKNSSPNRVTSADEIKMFKELLDQGIISEEEFNAKKKQLLGL